MKKNTKGAKGNQDFLKSNVETGAHNWNWAPNYGSSRMNQEEISNYKKQQLANAKKVGGGILNTNVETGNWHGMQFIVPEKSDRIGPNDLEAQEKFFAGQLKETITGPIPGQKGPKGQNAPVKFNNNGGWGQSDYGQNYGNSRDDRYQFVEKKPNNNFNEERFQPTQQRNNNMQYNPNYDQGYNPKSNNNANYEQNYQKKDNQQSSNKNYEEPDFDKLMEAGPGVMKLEASEKIITENGVQKKLTRIKKYMENGEIKEEIYKTNVK